MERNIMMEFVYCVSKKTHNRKMEIMHKDDYISMIVDGKTLHLRWKNRNSVKTKDGLYHFSNINEMDKIINEIFCE